jgi:Acetyltransferase (GNAT) domain
MDDMQRPTSVGEVSIMCTSLILNSTESVRLLLSENGADVCRWNAMVDAAPDPDIYYRPGYLRAHQVAGHGSAIAVQINAGRTRALFPFLLRPVSELGFAAESDGFDAGTAYGYGGLLLLDGIEQPNVIQTRAILDELQKWCRENGIVSVLLRLHPIKRQLDWLTPAIDADCALRRLGPTIALNTSCWNDSGRHVTTQSKGRHSDLNFARRNLCISWASERDRIVEYLQLFYHLYERRMDQLRATSFYHFPWEYYSTMAAELGGQLDVAITWLGSRPIAAAIFMADRKFAHYHLSAGDELGRAYKATTLILNEAVDWARKRGCRYLHLGGGTSGEDKLFLFKKSFYGEPFDFGLLGIVCDRRRYDALLQQRIADRNLPQMRTGRFPEYRA